MTTGFLRIALAALLLGPALGSALDCTVSAAASLREAFTEIGKEFEKAHAGTRVVFNFGASGQLLQQIARGAPVDVFASADPETMERAGAQNLIARDTRVNFAANKLVAVVRADSLLGIDDLSDLSAAEVQRIGLGTPASVPAGRYTKEALESAGLWAQLEPKYIFGQNVRQVLDYVARGEVDVGFVYLTDAALLKDKVKVVAEAPGKRPILYPIATVKGGGNEAMARKFVSYVTSDAGQKVLQKYGFAQP